MATASGIVPDRSASMILVTPSTVAPGVPVDTADPDYSAGGNASGKNSDLRRMAM